MAHLTRRQFVATSALAAGASAVAAPRAAPAEAPANAARRWRMVSRWPEGFPDQLHAARRLASHVAVMSGGRLIIEVLGPNEAGPYGETLDRVSSGEVEMARSLPYDWRDRGLGFDVFTFVPFGMTESERVIWLDHFGGQRLWDRLYEPLGVKPLLVGTVGPQSFGWFSQAITSLDQLRGLRFRTTGIGRDIFAALGATPRVMGLSEIGPAVESGELDGFELVGPAVDVALDVHRYFPVCVFPSLNQTAGSVELVINRERWAELPSDLRQILATAARAEHQRNVAEVHASNVAALARLRSEFDVSIAVLPDDVIARIGAVTTRILQQLRGRASAEHRAILDSYVRSRAVIAEWKELTEVAFSRARGLAAPYVQTD